MAELPLTLVTPEHIAKVRRNVDNEDLTPMHKERLTSLYALLRKTWDEECVLPGAPRATGLMATPPLSGTSPSAPVSKDLLVPAESIAPADAKERLIEGFEEVYYCYKTTPTKGRLQEVKCIEGYSKTTNPLHLAAKISLAHLEYFTIRCLIRTLWACKWDVDKTYEMLMKTILWRHQNLPRYFTDAELRLCARMRYMEWFGITKEVRDPITGALKEARCAILHLRAHCSDVTQTSESRCKFVILALEKGLHYMRQQYHGSQQKVLDAYKKDRSGEMFIFKDEDIAEMKRREQKLVEKEAKAALGSPVSPSSPLSSSTSRLPLVFPDGALKCLEDAIRGAVSEEQKKKAADYNPSISSSGNAKAVGPESFIDEAEMLEGAEQLVLLMDETASTTEKMDTKFLRFIAPILNSHYVERLRTCLVVNPTFISSVCVGIIKLVVDDRTKSKLNLFDVDPVALDEFLAETRQMWPGRSHLNAALVAAGQANAAARAADAAANLSPKDLEKKEKERRKASAKRAKDLPYDDVVYPSDIVINALGIENTPMKYGGRNPPLSANQYESWVNAVPPLSDETQALAERVREATRLASIKK